MVMTSVAQGMMKQSMMSSSGNIEGSIWYRTIYHLVLHLGLFPAQSTNIHQPRPYKTIYETMWSFLKNLLQRSETRNQLGVGHLPNRRSRVLERSWCTFGDELFDVTRTDRQEGGSRAITWHHSTTLRSRGAILCLGHSSMTTSATKSNV